MASAASAAAERPVCAICTDEILPNANVSKLNCNHQYHRDCLQPWLDLNHDTCPLDRRKIMSINGIALERPEMKGHDLSELFHMIVVANPLREVQTLYQRLIGVVQNPSSLWF